MNHHFKLKLKNFILFTRGLINFLLIEEKNKIEAINDGGKQHSKIVLSFFLSRLEYVKTIDKTSFQRKAEEIVNWNPRKKRKNKSGISYFTIVPDNLTIYMVIR